MITVQFFQVTLHEMLPWHQSRFVIDHKVTITASFDEHGSILIITYHVCICTVTELLRFSGLACQSGGEMSSRLHITATLMWSVYGDR